MTERMTMLEAELGAAIAAVLVAIAAKSTPAPVRILDIGVFPWHESIELSLLCNGDDANGDDADEGNIADWPLYNCACLQASEWGAAEPICSTLKQEWEKTRNILPILQIVARVMKTVGVQQAIQPLPRTPTFRIQILNPDDPDGPNYFS